MSSMFRLIVGIVLVILIVAIVKEWTKWRGRIKVQQELEDLEREESTLALQRAADEKRRKLHGEKEKSPETSENGRSELGTQ